MRLNATATIFVSAIIIGAGCAVGPNYQPPKAQIGTSFGAASMTANTNPPTADWWQMFHDPELTHLVGEALQGNYDLQIATARIRQSRFQRGIAAADLFPQADATAGYIRARGSKNVVLPLGGGSSAAGTPKSSASSGPKPLLATRNSESGGNSSSSSGSGSATPPLTPFGEGGLPGATTDLYQAGFDASWEIDVFGGKRRQVEAATAMLRAAAETRRDLMVTLLAEVARNYLELRGTEERLKIARQNVDAQTRILELTRAKRQAGLATELDVARAAALVSSSSATIPPLDANARRLVHALSTLVGKEPNALSVELEAGAPLPAVPPEIPVGLPSQLLERRPDIRATREQIAAATARIGVAEADLFPKFALIGSAGFDSTSAAHLFDWDSRYFLISPTVAWRIFDAGRIKSNIGLQRANQEETLLQYRGTILKALQEVEDALVAYATEQSRHTELADASQNNQLALELAKQSYDHGLVDFLNVLQAERDALAAQDALAQSNQSVSTDVVAIYKALGGGWDAAEHQP